MTNPKDPRTPQERAYSLDESGDDDTRVLYTSDPTEAYGRPVSNPTLVYPQYDPRFDPAAPQPNPTQQLGQPGYPPPQYQPPGYQPPGAPPAEPDPESRRPRGPRWGMLALAAGVLIVSGALAGFLLSGSGSDGAATATGPTTTAAPVPTTTAPAPAPNNAPSIPALPLDELPGGLGEVIGSSGAVVGTITANDGTSLTLSSLGGSLVTVLLTPETQIIALAGNTPDALTIGATAVATGTPVEQGRMTAETVVSASLPAFGRSGN
ncbi:hypothetical protein [Rhodococcus chondri]|uniref:DUF5666 domain-containing protein n=1 Tax=Rhodococcus chondri TaxID=3065941 RepID=A0ABU7JPD5_9NOCA|nr:hypothetical protein [Rhodococcus sp. CC-R104]MEE2031334.1 hypothetical protein [Rhodococcus sp. CC-R104]